MSKMFLMSEIRFFSITASRVHDPNNHLKILSRIWNFYTLIFLSLALELEDQVDLCTWVVVEDNVEEILVSIADAVFVLLIKRL